MCAKVTKKDEPVRANRNTSSIIYEANGIFVYLSVVPSIIMHKTIQWGILGCGDVCEIKSGPAFNKVADSRLVAVMRRDEEKVKDYAKRHGVPKWYVDADALINDPEVNAIYIATPPHMHAEYTRRAAEAGKPVYVEKPMARTHEECKAMIEVCEKHQVPLFVAYYRRCLPNFLKTKEMIDEGVIGEVRVVSIQLYQASKPSLVRGLEHNWRVIPEIAGGGYFYDLASHQFDYLDYVFGPITEVTGAAANQAGEYVAEDVVAASFIFESGVAGSGIWCFTTAQSAEKDEISIIGNKGKIRMSTFDNHAPVILENARGREDFSFTPPENIQRPLIETVVASLLRRGECPSTGISAARTNWVLEQIMN